MRIKLNLLKQQCGDPANAWKVKGLGEGRTLSEGSEDPGEFRVSWGVFSGFFPLEGPGWDALLPLALPVWV